MTRLLAVLILAFTAGASAAASILPPSLTGPRIEASAVAVSNTIDLGLLTADSDAATFGALSLDFFQLTRFDDGSGFASAGLLGGTALLSGDLVGTRTTPDGLLFGFVTDFDDFGIGPAFSVLLFPGATPFPADPFGTDFSVSDASATVAAPVPLPAGMALLLTGLLSLLAIRRRGGALACRA